MAAVAPAIGSQGNGQKHLSAEATTWTAKQWELAVGYPGSPPIAPATVQKFLILLASYQALDSDTPISFSQWIIANGVTDPREQICMIWLYWNFINRTAVD